MDKKIRISEPSIKVLKDRALELEREVSQFQKQLDEHKSAAANLADHVALASKELQWIHDDIEAAEAKKRE